ncbi:MAG: gliding motility protein GldM [Flavobacteriaceae bacterium]|nr:gliding motility protein GldM [Flavobacteriaceae bacterium]
MAGAKETPRQKLISLMYLVFITMLALNVSKEVLDGFGQMFKKIQSSNIRLDQSNDVYYNKISTNAAEKEGKWLGHDRTAKQIKVESDSFFDKIQEIKNKITETQRIKDPELENYKEMDKGEALDLILFSSSGESEEGEAFVEMIMNYRGEVVQVFGSQYPQYIDLVEERFYTGDFEHNITNKDGSAQSWLSYNYEGFPLVSSLAKLTMMQSDIRATEQDVLTTLLGKELELESGVNESNYITLLKTEKGAYYQGEIFNGSVILGRKGGAQNPNSVNITIDGEPLQEGDYELIPGGIRLNVTTGAPGDHLIEGDLIFLNEGVESKIPVIQSFPVISKPNSAVISADKMNVVYRGVDNPMTISIPGIANNKVSVSATGLRKVKGSNYLMTPGKGREVLIRASATLPDGNKITTSTKFRVKDIPAPVGTVRGLDGIVSLNKTDLEISPVGGILKDFDFDIKLQTVSFKFKVPGKPTITVQGNKLDARAKTALKGAKRGQAVQIFDVKVKNPKSPKYVFKQVAPVIINIGG